MAEATVKPLQPPKSEKPRVQSMQTGEGGVQLPGLGQVQSHLSLSTPWCKVAGLDMELDRNLGGVLVTYQASVQGKQKPFFVLVPMAHVRLLELA